MPRQKVVKLYKINWLCILGVAQTDEKHLLARKGHFLSPLNGNRIGMIVIGYTS
jgi:hypothetical protein